MGNGAYTPKLITTLKEGYDLHLLRADALAGLTVESMILYPIALAIVGWYWATPGGSAIFQGWDVALAVAWSGPMTAVPLMMFATAARRMPYTVIGFLQFSSPTIVTRKPRVRSRSTADEPDTPMRSGIT